MTLVASLLESGWLYYPLILLAPIASGVVLALRRPERRGLWVLAAVVAAFVLLDFALDDTRSEDVAFFVVLALFMFALGLLARWVAGRLLRPTGT